jgi:hypothetical protein
MASPTTFVLSASEEYLGDLKEAEAGQHLPRALEVDGD